MCGRYANARRDADLVNAFKVEDVRDPELQPSWNVAPMQNVRIVLERLKPDEPEQEPKRQLRTARWGLVPPWAKDPAIGSRMINARSEPSPRSRRSRTRPGSTGASSRPIRRSLDGVVCVSEKGSSRP